MQLKTAISPRTSGPVRRGYRCLGQSHFRVHAAFGVDPDFESFLLDHPHQRLDYGLALIRLGLSRWR